MFSPRGGHISSAVTPHDQIWKLPFTRYAEGVELLRRKEAIKIRFYPWAS